MDEIRDTGANFTPGPWGVEATDFNLWIGPMRPDGGKVERVVVGLDADPTYTEAYTIRRNADAHLIAAAPETHSAGEALLARVDQLVRESCEPLFVEEREALRAALAKGRGAPTQRKV